MRNNYHFCTDALKDALLCYDDNDYKAAWNILAESAMMTGIKVYCFCIMSNHIHILLCAGRDDIARFFLTFKMKMGRYVARKYHKTMIRGMAYRLFPVTDMRAFCQEVAYILRNPFRARISSPFTYRWSSIRAYFGISVETGVEVNELPDRQRFKVLKSRYSFPAGTRVSSEGLVLPGCFLDVFSVERAFNNSSIQFFNLLKQWNLEDIVRGIHGETVQDSYSDNEIYAAIRQECLNVYDVSDPTKLDYRSLVRVIRKIRARFGASGEQLKRLLPVDDAFLDRML